MKMKFKMRNLNLDQKQNKSSRCFINNKGTTLFEVLLYIALFTILSSATIYLYISILKTTDALGFTLQKIEIRIYARQLAEHQLDTSQTIDTQTLQNGMERILRWYPNFRLVDVDAEYVPVEDSVGNTIGNNGQIIDVRFTNLGLAGGSVPRVDSIIKLTYRLEEKSKKNIFTNTIYLSAF